MSKEVTVIKMFQYWDKTEPPHEVQRMMRSWQNHHKFRLFLYDYKKAKRFIKNNLPEEQFDAFIQCGVPAMQADFFRYCALYKHGGIYIDADIKMREGKFHLLKELLDEADRGLVMTREKAVANDFLFIRKSGDPLIWEVITKATKNIKERISNNVWEVTGPGIMTEMYKAEGEDYFKDFSFVSFKQMREIIEFKWNLNYKKGDGHWTNVQETKSIFID